MTIKLLAAYGTYPTNAIITLDAGTEAGLVAANLASATLTGGVTYVAPLPPPQTRPVMATTNPGGVIRNSTGGIVWRPGWNQLVKTPPKRIVATHGWDNEVTYDAAVASTGGVAELSNDLASPIEGTGVLKFSGMTTTTACHVTWIDRCDEQCAQDDVWIFAVWLTKTSGGVTVKARLAGAAADFSTAGTFRTYVWASTRLRVGWNFLTCRHVEEYVAPTTYGVVGNTTTPAWIEGASFNASSAVKSLRLEVSSVKDVSFYVAGAWKAPKGWCTSVIMLGADDVPVSFYEKAIPELERRGLPYHLNITAQFTRRTGVHMSIDNVRECANKGAEILSHTNRHLNPASATTEEIALDIQRARTFFMSNGLGSAARGMAWPFNTTNAALEAAAKAAGYKWSRAATGFCLNSWQAPHHMYALPSFTFETENSWLADTEIRRLNDCGLAGITYIHNTVDGGAGINTYPGSYSHYFDHLVRWLDQIEGYIANGSMVALTVGEYWQAIGIDVDAVAGVEI